MKSISLLAVAGVLFAVSTTADAPVELSGGPNEIACYSNVANYGFIKNGTWSYQTDGYCKGQCSPLGYTVMATTKGSDCWCGNEIPAASVLVDDASSCTTSCFGFGNYTCGGPSAWTVYLTGLSKVVSTASGVSTSTSTTGSSSSTQMPETSVITAPAETITATAPSSATSGPATTSAVSKGSSPSKAGIAAGVVVGIVAIAAIAGGGFIFMRSKKRRNIEEEHRRNAAVNSFIGGGKPGHGSGAGSSFTDTRLDPVLASRRMSDGSIADNQDYSRRILKVTNA